MFSKSYVYCCPSMKYNILESNDETLFVLTSFVCSSIMVWSLFKRRILKKDCSSFLEFKAYQSFHHMNFWHCFVIIYSAIIPVTIFCLKQLIWLWSTRHKEMNIYGFTIMLPHILLLPKILAQLQCRTICILEMLHYFNKN